MKFSRRFVIYRLKFVINGSGTTHERRIAPVALLPAVLIKRRLPASATAYNDGTIAMIYRSVDGPRLNRSTAVVSRTGSLWNGKRGTRDRDEFQTDVCHRSLQEAQFRPTETVETDGRVWFTAIGSSVSVSGERAFHESRNPYREIRF